MVVFYADTLINHFIYADDLCIFTLSVAVLRTFTECCTKYGELFDITYHINESYCMVINRKSQEMTSIHCVNLNNRSLPDTMTCKHIGHIINNNVTDDDDIAVQKSLHAQSIVSAQNIVLLVLPPKLPYCQLTLLQCTLHFVNYFHTDIHFRYWTSQLYMKYVYIVSYFI